jgi:hypothetical protein
MVIFELDAKQAKKTFTEIKKILKAARLWKITTRIEITVMDGQIQLIGNGFTLSMESLTTGTCKLVLPIIHWFELVNMTSQPLVKVVVTEGEAMVGRVSVKVQTTFFETDKILRSILLPANPKPIDFWKLQFQGYTKEELVFNKLIVQIESANKELSKSIRKAAELFTGFRISEVELRKMVLKWIEEKEKIEIKSV